MPAFQPKFAVTIAPVRVRFGDAALAVIKDEVARLGCHRALVLTTHTQADMAESFAQALGDDAAGVFTDARMHTPTEVTESALAHLRALGADCLVAVGGGSTTGLGKALALRTDLPQIVVPTTYAGSEATAILGQTEGGRKTTITDPRVQPEVIIYDPSLVATLPVPLTVASGLNAMAHAVEALYARDRNPLSSALAVQGLQAMVDGLPAVLANPSDLTARSQTLYGAWLCGTVLGQVGMALHHKLAHVLGGSFDLPHAETHAILLPHTIGYNATAAATELSPLAAMLAAPPGKGLHDFARSLGAPLALRDLGLTKADLDRATDIALQNPYWNPAPLTRPGIRALLEAAWAGDAPI
ncbi:maleylacetate reductase [Tabrizicola sp.]|uniref:maleylacetate reductase n=1 Tax=Tabrizicola sp. TaxID=2005166 RepID=UPI003F3BF119